MHEIRIYKSPWKAIKIILLATPFIFLSLYDILTHSVQMPPILDWFALCFFGLGIPFGIYNLFDRRPEVILNETGIFDRQSTNDFISWELIKNAFTKYIRVTALSKQEFLCLTLIPGATPSLKRPKFLNRANTNMGFGDVSIALTQLKKADWKKLVNFINSMANANDTVRQNLLLNYEL